MLSHVFEVQQPTGKVKCDSCLCVRACCGQLLCLNRDILDSFVSGRNQFKGFWKVAKFDAPLLVLRSTTHHLVLS